MIAAGLRFVRRWPFLVSSFTSVGICFFDSSTIAATLLGSLMSVSSLVTWSICCWPDLVGLGTMSHTFLTIASASTAVVELAASSTLASDWATAARPAASESGLPFSVSSPASLMTLPCTSTSTPCSLSLSWTVRANRLRKASVSK